MYIWLFALAKLKTLTKLIGFDSPSMANKPERKIKIPLLVGWIS